MARRKKSPPPRKLDARADTLDFRDRMFVPTLVEVPTRMPLSDYLAHDVPILDQGTEGACTGFGLATVAHYLLRRRVVTPDCEHVSPRMLYHMARRYDEWPGERYEGSSARGAIKGWHKHGICSELHWPYNDSERDAARYAERWSDAVRRPLGAYFRVNHRDLVAMHSALAEVHVLYATATVHEGWNVVGDDGEIVLHETLLGGHAFAIVAYDEDGFWIQNSWGPDWGANGFARMSYDDWLANGTDIWVARLGAPVRLGSARATATGYTAAARGSRGYVYQDLRPHIISTGNDGRPRTSGEYGTDEQDIADLFTEAFPRVTDPWPKRRLLLYAHGGLVAEESAVQRLADYRATLLAAQVYPVSFIWKTDYWSTITNILQDALRRRRPEGLLDASKDFMLDRLDDALEPLARALTGRAQWREMQENAIRATIHARGGARVALGQIRQLADRYGSALELHVVGHSAGSIFHAPLIQLLTTQGRIASGPLAGQTGLGLTVATCTLWAPACTVELFRRTYLPAIQAGGIRRFALFTLNDSAEQDDHCANLYHKSLLYLVSNAFEGRPRVPGLRDGVPLLGLERCVEADRELRRLFVGSERAVWVRSPNDAPIGSPMAARARTHGDFDDDAATLQATFARIGSVAAPPTAPVSAATDDADRASEITIHRSAAGARDRRAELEQSG